MTLGKNTEIVAHKTGIAYASLKQTIFSTRDEQPYNRDLGGVPSSAIFH
jgi:hypothetical protein